MSPVRFADLPIGSTFAFYGEHQYSGMAVGPWRKVSARRYRHVDPAMHAHYGGNIKVGAIAAEAYVIEETETP